MHVQKILKNQNKFIKMLMIGIKMLHRNCKYNVKMFKIKL